MINNANDKRDGYKIWEEGVYVQGDLYDVLQAGSDTCASNAIGGIAFLCCISPIVCNVNSEHFQI